MRVGNLRHRIQIQKKVKTQDSTGQVTYDWTTVGPDPTAASVKALGATERVEAAKIDSEVTYSIVIRNATTWTDLDHSYRAIGLSPWAGKYFAVHGVTHLDPNGRWLMLWCSEGVQDGEQ